RGAPLRRARVELWRRAATEVVLRREKHASIGEADEDARALALLWRGHLRDLDDVTPLLVETDERQDHRVAHPIRADELGGRDVRPEREQCEDQHDRRRRTREERASDVPRHERQGRRYALVPAARRAAHPHQRTVTEADVQHNGREERRRRKCRDERTRIDERDPMPHRERPGRDRVYLGEIYADGDDDRREDAERDPEQQRDRRQELIVVLPERAVKLLECILVVEPRAARATELAGAHLFEDARKRLRQFGLLDLVDDEPEATRDRIRRGRADDDRTMLHVDAIDFGPAVRTARAIGKEGY